MSESEEVRREMYLEYLVNEGFSPTLDSDGDIEFKFEGGTYLILVDGSDEDYFRVIYPNFWEIESEEEREAAIRAACQATADTKVAKIYLVDDNTWASAEIFCEPIANFRNVFPRLLRCIQSAVSTFRDEMV